MPPASGSRGRERRSWVIPPGLCLRGWASPRVAAVPPARRSCTEGDETCLGGCNHSRKLYSCEVALEKSVLPLGIARTRNTDAEKWGIHVNNSSINGIMCSRFLFLPGREEWKESLAMMPGSTGPHRPLKRVSIWPSFVIWLHLHVGRKD